MQAPGLMGGGVGYSLDRPHVGIPHPQGRLVTLQLTPQSHLQRPPPPFPLSARGAASFPGYSAVQGPSTCMVRPHPAVWRLVHGIMVCYLLLMVYLLFQNVDDARQFLRVRQGPSCCLPAFRRPPPAGAACPDASRAGSAEPPAALIMTCH